jgi:hypothetical protein
MAASPVVSAISAAGYVLVKASVFRRAENSAKLDASSGISMRALIFSLIVMAASAAQAQTASPSKEALTLGGQVARAAQPKLEQGIQALVDGFASGYRDGAARSGQAVDDKALADVGKSEVAAARPLIWDGMAKAYAQTYTVDELKALNNYYYEHPGDQANLPATLAAKSPQLQQQQAALLAQVGPRIMQDFFGDYCSRATCSNYTRRSVGLPVKGD